MPRLEQMLDRLPSLYRPEPDSTALLLLFMKAVAQILDDANSDAAAVMRSHWFQYSDRALYDAFFNRTRTLMELPPLPVTDPELDLFPYIKDLGRLAGLVSLPPWSEPAFLRENVEAYRTRIRRVVALYRNGLGTVDALRSMVEAQLPLVPDVSEERQDRSFWIEEFAPIIGSSLEVPTRGEPAGVVGPLMRWTVDNIAIDPTPPTLYIQGVEPVADEIDATENPLVEIYHNGGTHQRLGIAYRGTVEPGQTLRVRPAFGSWIGTADGVHRAQSLPTDSAPADPTSPGPWQAVAGGPSGNVAASGYTLDRSLYVASNSEGTGTLFRFDGTAWTTALDSLAAVNCLYMIGDHLLIGTQSGLSNMNLYPPDGEPFSASPVTALAGQSVNVLYTDRKGQMWIGTDAGLGLLAPSADPVAIYDLQASELQGAEVFDISEDRAGILYIGISLGLVQYHPSIDKWYFYSGEEFSDQQSDWLELSSGSLPNEALVFLPPVRRVVPGPDSSLWIGTDTGIARYTARSVRGLTYKTLLEAFPDLADGNVFTIEIDARGIVWFGTSRGIFRYDGRDMWQYQSDTWVQLGRADSAYNEIGGHSRGSWRYARTESQWQTYDVDTGQWVDESPELRSTDETAAHAITWTDGAYAELGTWDGSVFTSSVAVPDTDLVVRYKPTEDRVVEGGIPAIPRLPTGTSTWRYLSLEPETVPEPSETPYWSIEGRLFSPSVLNAAAPGRFDIETPPPENDFDEVVFAYNPAARVWFEWEPRQPLTVLVRLKKLDEDEYVDPAILDRVWQGMQQVRPAGVRATLAVEEQIVRGAQNGSTG